MASKLNVTLKRYNGVDIDSLYPTTHFGQIYTDSTETTTIQSYLDSTYINLDEKGAINGVAPLDENAKIPETHLPVSVLGGLKYVGALTANTDLDTLGAGQDSANDSGAYWIATAEITLTTSGASTVLEPGDEGDSDLSNGIVVEAGDWIILSSWADDPAAYEFAIVNNTYQYATVDNFGIARLTNATNAGQYNASTNPDGLDSTSHVLTESFLKTNMAEGELNGGAGGANDVLNKVASSNHIHDGRYYTETEVADFFSGNTAINGYNKTNWDTAYNDKINSAAFNSADGVLTLTQQDSGTVTVDLDGRYAESITAAQTDSTDGIDIVQTGDDYTIAHHDTSSVADITGTNGNVLQEMTFDTFGHVLTRTTTNLDDRYYTETEIDNWLTGASTLGPNNDSYTPIEYGEDPTSSVTGAILIDLD